MDKTAIILIALCLILIVTIALRIVSKIVKTTVGIALVYAAWTLVTGYSLAAVFSFMK